MAYVVQKRIIRLTFADDHEFAGLEVQTRAVSSEDLMDLMEESGELAELVSTVNLENLQPGTLKTVREKTDRLVDAFAASLISWNVEEEADEEGQPPVPVAATLDGVKSLDFLFRTKLMKIWFEKVGGVAKDLGKDSSSGVIFPEGSLPMAPLSPSPLSLSVPA